MQCVWSLTRSETFLPLPARLLSWLLKVFFHCISTYANNSPCARKELSWRQDISDCRKSCHQDFGQNKTGSKDTETALKGNIEHGKTAPSECDTPLRSRGNSRQTAHRHGICRRRGAFHQNIQRRQTERNRSQAPVCSSHRCCSAHGKFANVFDTHQAIRPWIWAGICLKTRCGCCAAELHSDLHKMLSRSQNALQFLSQTFLLGTKHPETAHHSGGMWRAVRVRQVSVGLWRTTSFVKRQKFEFLWRGL